MSVPAPSRDPAPPARAPQPRLWARWRARARQGPRVLAYHLVRRARARCGLTRLVDLQVHEIVAVPSWRLRLPPRPARGLRVAEAAPGQLAQLERLRPPVGESYAARFAAAHRCIAAWLDERVVAFVWLRRGPCRMATALGYWWYLPAAFAWIYDIYSDPQVLGAVPYLYAYLRQHPPGEGVQLLAGQTELDNQRSRLAHRSIGYEVMGSLCSLRLGGWRLHCSCGVVAPGRRWHRGHALIPLHVLAGRFEHPGMAAPAGDVRLQCECGRGVTPREEAITCACGRRLGVRRDGLTRLGPELPYWGEIGQAEMAALLQRAERMGWREAVASQLPDWLLDSISSPERAAFHELLPIAAGARVLELGAGWGGVAAPLARHYRVVALEAVAERARFLALRRRQDGLRDLEVIQGDGLTAPLAAGQFDAVIANGVLPWVAVLEEWGRPREVQTELLCRLRDLLAPGGVVYLAAENRCAWADLRGRRDLSGLRFTSLLPRPLARLVCARRRMRATRKTGYRTYTYTYRGYERLFGEAGLRIVAAWVSPGGGYNRPEKMVPLQHTAIRYVQGGAPRSWLRRAGMRSWVWRWLAPDFAFLLAPAEAASPARTAEPQHA